MSLSLAAGTAIAGLAAAGASAANSGINYGLTTKMNKRQEALMRESWAREDTAVQRRVADLKAAGLSPILAAGSAAETSGPIKLNTPQVDLSGVVNHSLEAMSAVQALKGQKLENDIKKKQSELLDKQIGAFGLPDWYNALINTFGLEGVRDWLKGIGHSNGSSIINNLYEGLVSGMPGGLKFGFMPNKGYSSAPQQSIPEPVKESLQEHGASVSYSTEGQAVAFESRAAARQWFLDIGGTTAEWYDGVRKYGSPEAFLDWILGTGGYYFK